MNLISVNMTVAVTNSKRSHSLLPYFQKKNKVSGLFSFLLAVKSYITTVRLSTPNQFVHERMNE